MVQQVGSYVAIVGSYVAIVWIKNGSKNGSKLWSEIVNKVGSKNSVLAFLKCMDGSVLVFLKYRDGSALVSLKCMVGSVLAHHRFIIQYAPTGFPQSGNSGVP